MSLEKESTVKGGHENYNSKLLQRGDSHYKARLYKAAFNAYEEAILFDSGNVTAYVGKGDCLYSLGHSQEALNAYREALSIDPKNIAAYIGKGYAYANIGDIIGSLLSFNCAIKLDPQQAVAYNGKGKALSLQYQYEEALQAFEQAIKLATDSDDIDTFYYNKGRVLCALARYQMALDTFILALHLKSDDRKYHDSIVNIPWQERKQKSKQCCEDAEKLSSQDSYEKALQLFDTALLVNTESVRAYVGKGKALHRMKRYKEALTAFNLALLQDNKFPAAYVGKGHIFLELNRSMDALKCYGDAIELRTDDISCYINVGDILLDLQFYEEVVQIHSWVLQHLSDLVLYPSDHGKALLGRELQRQYIAAGKEVIKREASNIVTYANIRDAFTMLGFQEEASLAHNKALTLAMTKDKQDTDLLWSLICHTKTTSCSAHIQFDLLQRYVINDPQEPRRKDALQRISRLFPDPFDSYITFSEIFQRNIRLLHSLLLHLAEEERAKALTLIVSDDDIRLAQLLIHLAPFSLPGLTSLAHQVTLRWVLTPRNDDLVIRLYHTLDSYGVPFELPFRLK